MKAKDYYDKYGKAVFDETAGDEKPIHLQEMLVAFLREMKDTIAQRKVSTDRGAVSVIKEMNEKWNALCAIFEKERGASPIRRNGLLIYLEGEIPALKDWSRKP